MTASQAQVDFRKIESAEEMAKVWSDAQAQNKSVFIDIYATWCGPCKWMDANVFALEEAGDYMNEKFINVKMDGESTYGREFASLVGLSAYPSFFLFKNEKEVMNTMVGAKGWDEFEVSLDATLEYYPVMSLLQSKFESNLLERADYPRFMNALRGLGNEEYANEVAQYYIDNELEEGPFKPVDIKTLAFAGKNMEQVVLNMMMSDIPAVREALGDDLSDYIDHVVTSAINNAVTVSDRSYIDDLSKHLPELTKGTEEDAKLLTTRMNVYYLHYDEQYDELISFINDGFTGEFKGDHAWLYKAAEDAVFLDPNNLKLVREGVNWFEQCIALQETFEYYYSLAVCQYYLDRSDLTIEHLKKAITLTNDQEQVETALGIIKQLEAEME